MQIDVTDATLSFSGRNVFEKRSAQFASRRVTALVGPSGSGKSSLLSAMAGYLALDAGSVLWSEPGGESRRPDPTLVAWVPQGANVLGTRTAVDNVMIGPLSEGLSISEAAKIATSALTDVGLSHAIHDRVRTLSGGEVQRVCFARALASRKPVIFADEPSSSLDAANTERLAELLLNLRSRATIVVATHDPLLVAAAEAEVHLRSERVDAAR